MKLSIAILCALLVPSLARGYMVPPAVALAVLEKEADVIVKGTVVSSGKVKDESFKAYPHWAVFSTRMKVVSVLKGDLAEKEIDFRHYDADPDSKMGYMFAPQHYHFEAGRSYLVFAKRTGAAGVLRPLTDFHRGKADQGQVLAGDDGPVAAGADVKRAVWDELAKLVGGESPKDVVYAIGQIHSMSGAADRYDGTRDFSREKVLEVLGPLVGHKEPEVAAAAIGAVGARSPYMTGDHDMGWLATVGKGTLLARGHAKYAEGWDNPDARGLQGRLVEVAEKGKSGELRGRAIRALGLSKDRALLEPLRKWSNDPAHEVRAAAAMLWSDFPGEEGRRELSRLAGDKEVAVRRAVASAVGHLQSPELLPLLEGFLRDKDERLRAAAAMSAISFDPKESAGLLKAFKNDPDFRAPFVNALALSEPKAYLDELARVVRTNDEPKLYFVAQMPVYTSWQILKAEMETRTGAELGGGALDKYLDALEYPPNIGSGPYQEMYRFYLEKGLRERAARFREDVKKRVTTYDIDYFFKRVDGE
jgi:hypothetical protein